MKPVLLAVFLVAPPLAAQIEPVVTMHGGQTVTRVYNAGTDTLQYDVELLARTVPDSGAILLGRAVAALIAPRSFRLAPGEHQIIRIRLREAAPTPTLGLAITMTPMDALTPDDTGRTGTRITLVVRHVAKVLLQ